MSLIPPACTKTCPFLEASEQHVQMLKELLKLAHKELQKQHSAKPKKMMF